ncbi:hypothetical protein Sango_2800900 [Sesamum angolense]|uniref:Uncharacterized protein n=1 Tax=Sesamum angolense TaxID=2727404 RepID=A0AAE1T744_9LAMI|nr:hypothetical protein Sango_2800900 [Sesamum angolense]
MVVQPHVAQPIAAQGERLEKFFGNDFKRWHQKMLFYLTTLNLVRNYILNGLSDTLYNVYSSATTARALWESLEKKYKIEDTDLKKFIVRKFLDFKMVDSKMEMGLEDLIVRLRIEEDNRLFEMKSGKLQIEAKANLMEQNGNPSIKRKCIDYKAKREGLK